MGKTPEIQDLVGKEFIGHVGGSPETKCYTHIDLEQIDDCGEVYTYSVYLGLIPFEQLPPPSEGYDVSKVIQVDALYNSDVEVDGQVISLTNTSSFMERMEGYEDITITLGNSGAIEKVKGINSDGYLPDSMLPWTVHFPTLRLNCEF
jgi:hypothetical protein